MNYIQFKPFVINLRFKGKPREFILAYLMAEVVWKALKRMFIDRLALFLEK
jgi:hypothetical protein